MKDFVDNSIDFERSMFGGIGDGAIRAARKLRTFSRRKVNRKFHASKAAQKKQGKKTTGASKSGEPPKRRSGKGRLSIEARKVKAPQGRDGEFAKTYSSKRKAAYMSMYEFAPAGIKRPWLAPALAENKDALFTILITPVQKKLRNGGRKL